MTDKQLKDFKAVVRQIVGCKPASAPRQPDKAPSAVQLRQRYKLVKQ